MASPFSSPEYMAFLAQRKRAMGIPFTNSNAYRPNVPTPVIGAGGGTGQAPNTAIPHVGGDTWEMNSNRDGQQFNGPSGFKASFAGGGDQGDRIHGYEGAGLNTRDFSQMTGRGPTASDVEMAQGGGLAPTHPQMGSLDSYYAMLRGPSQWQQLQASVSGGGGGMLAAPAEQKEDDWVTRGRGMAPFPTGPAMDEYGKTTSTPPLPALAPYDPRKGTLHYRPPSLAQSFHLSAPWKQEDVAMRADGGDVEAGQPTIVGERGPEMIVPKNDMTVIPNEYLPTQHLMRGDILEYLKRHMR